ncbi:MAG TPA: isoprenylcysteine carboxylmethyltransferase family protein [Gemmatimonadales bacterium]|nr:isoprenylcysteine carboxylmethyltransferase family protein [Gemmatimonadales bacterium]
MTELAGFLAMERLLRKGSVAATLDRGKHDRGSTIAIGVAFGTAMVLAAVTSRSRSGRLPVVAGFVGNAAMATGIGVRWWAARTLGESYTRTLRTRPGQRVVDSGLYRRIRHPGYAADIVMWIGIGLAWMNSVSVLASAVPIITAYAYRISREETMLREALGEEYVLYTRRTARLLPGIY